MNRNPYENSYNALFEEAASVQRKYGLNYPIMGLLESKKLSPRDFLAILKAEKEFISDFNRQGLQLPDAGEDLILFLTLKWDRLDKVVTDGLWDKPESYFWKVLEAHYPDRPRRAAVSSFNEIESKSVEWLWPGKIPIGKLTIFAGDPGQGKSQATLDVAARLSKGQTFPDGGACQSGDVLIMTSEDDPGDTIKPRLDILGANTARIHFLEGKQTKDRASSIILQEIDIIQDAVFQVQLHGGQVRLLIVDPLEGYLGDTDTRSNVQVREALGRLVALASDERFAVLGVQHLNKGSQGSPSYRIGGSIAFTALARSVWIFGRDPQNRGRRVFLCLKNNLAKDNTGLEYQIEEAPNGQPHIAWGEIALDDPRDILSYNHAQEKKTVAPEQDKVQEFLQKAYPKAVHTKELADLLGKSRQSIGNILSKLKQRGLAQPSTPYGYWVFNQGTPPVLAEAKEDNG